MKAKNIDKKHKDLTEYHDARERCKDARAGQQVIHKKGAQYLPKLSGQKPDEYSAYKRRAIFYGAYSRTVDAFIGMILRVPPVVDNPSPLLDDITGHGESLAEFAESILEDVLVESFAGLLVDYPTLPESGLTVAQAEQMGARPYLVEYDADDIVNWRYAGKVLTQVIVTGEDEIVKSEFEIECKRFWLVLDLDEQGFYRQRKFVKSTGNTEEFEQIGDDVYPLMSGKKLTLIPFWFVGCTDELPPLMDIADLNISHYITTADLENGCHYTGIPQPWVAGVQLDDNETLSIGGVNAWVFPDPQANAEYLEFTGQGLGALEKRLETKEKQMAALGARMLSETTVQETATAAGLKSSGEFSVLAQLSSSVAKSLTIACTFMHEWQGLGPVNIELNTDFLPTQATPQEIQAWLQTYQAGGMSFQSFYGNLKKGEIYLYGADAEQEQAAIGDNPASLMTMGNNGD